ncbi:hypothetical protein RI129_010927 [Pyrocoelia pectoralis]|uniref:Sodium-coupled monocarboxylate transporter 1 n=1 Tax=Pyrocoelia pectoralis TaxID=417401 RepID=A0AAN7ZGW6_9COLE
MNLTYFSWIDYAFFGATILISLLIGIYYGCFGTKQKTTEEYLHGGKQMRSFPVGMSLAASYLSGITILGVPTEIYLYGTQLAVCPITILLLIITIVYIYLPVYYKLQLPSSYEYLKIRFGPELRTFASLLYVLSTILHVPIVIYIPSLALNQVTGIDVYIISLLICSVCIFYTTLGGLKAVVLSDTIQFTLTIMTTLIVLVIGTYNSGGIINIWNNASDRGRIEFFNMNSNPTVRQTFWGVVIGMWMTFIGNLGVNPSSVQRFLSLPTYSAVKRAAVIFGLGTTFVKLASCWIGLILFTVYMNCDPFLSGKISRIDQLLPYYLLDVGRLKGLPGLFVAGVCGTALSSMSTSINTLSLTIYEDFLKSKLPSSTSRGTTNLLLKGIVVVSGILCLALIFLIEKLGGVLQMSLSFHSVTHGPLVGIISLGMLFPIANKQGALLGGIVSLIITGILVFGAQVYILMGKVQHTYKSLSTAHCDTNITTPMWTSGADPEKPPIIFQISFYFYTLISLTITVIVGVLVGWWTRKKEDPNVDRDLLSPVIYRFLSHGSTSAPQELSVYESVETALTKLKTATE